MKTYYCDHAATTQCRPEIWDQMRGYAVQEYGNSNSIHRMGRAAQATVNRSREEIAELLGATADEFIFTSGGTESVQLALQGAVLGNPHLGNEIITTAVEHEAVLRTCDALLQHQIRTTYLQPDVEGRISPQQVADAISDDTAILSIIHANNELGTVQNLKAIAEAARQKKPSIIIHTDAVQSVGHIPIDLRDLDVDLLSFAAHKFYGPKGIGALYIRKGVEMHAQIFGGAQECGLRGGTLSVPLIVGMAAALRAAVAEMDSECVFWRSFRDRAQEAILNRVPSVKITARSADRLDHFLHVSVHGVKGEDLVLLLDQKGICASAGAACNISKGGVSHVISALRLPRVWSEGSLRLTFGRHCRDLDPDWLAQQIAESTADLRGTSAELATLSRSH